MGLLQLAVMDYDMIVIGGGSAGFGGARTASELGLRVAVIEGGEDVGGLCILKGCMPSKTLIESANRCMSIRRASEFGLRASNIEVHGEEIIARKRRLIAEFAGYRQQQLETGSFDFIRGFASFVDPNTIEVRNQAGGAHRLAARTFLLATGSCVNRFEFPGLEETGYIISDEVLERESIPQSVVVLGGGATGLELAHYYNGLGADVTVIQRSDQVLRELDRDVADALTDAMRSNGMKVYCGTALQRFEKADGMKRVFFRHGGEELCVEAEEIFYALGRRPFIDGLQLENAGVRVEQCRVCIQPSQQTDVPHIFAAGDVGGPFEVVHIAIQQAELAARNAQRLIAGGGELEEMDYRLKLFVIFTHPQAAMVGLSEREAKEAGLDIAVAAYPFNDHGKAMVIGETEGFVKLVVSRETGHLLGGSAVGPMASELIHELSMAIHLEAKVEQFAAAPRYHPTLSEIWSYPAEELAAELEKSRKNQD